MAISEVCWKDFLKKVKLYPYTWIRFKVFRLPGTWTSGYTWVFVLSLRTIWTPLCTTSFPEYLTNQVFSPLFTFVFFFFFFFWLWRHLVFIGKNSEKTEKHVKKFISLNIKIFVNIKIFKYKIYKYINISLNINVIFNIFWIIVFQIFFFLSLSSLKVDQKCVIFCFNDFARVKKLAAT